MICVESLRRTADEMLSGLEAGEAIKRRIVFKAEAAQQLSSVAEEMLGGLHAGSALRHRILVKYERKVRAMRRWRPPVVQRRSLLAPAMSLALVLALMVGFGIYVGDGQQAQLPGSGLATYASGTLSVGGVPEFTPLFAGEAANPPLVSINGRYYRMMESPVPVAAGLLDSTLAEVQTFTEEPSLNATAGIFSNVVPTGGQIYGIVGLSSKTAVAAEVDGVMRLFQRISYAGSATLGNEMFQDTLDVQGQVAALELSGVGVITDEEAANEVLVYMLSEFATFTGADTVEAEQALTVYLHNGLTLQLLAENDVLYGCGGWTCPGFEDAFRAEMNK